ncbi:hypothetical protein D3C75_844120 [compost metagenome]
MQRTRFTWDFLFAKNMFQLMADLFDIQRFQVELQAARKNSDRQLLWIGSRQQEFNV